MQNLFLGLMDIINIIVKLLSNQVFQLNPRIIFKQNVAYKFIPLFVFDEKRWIFMLLVVSQKAGSYYTT